jgi:hypothetical protein
MLDEPVSVSLNGVDNVGKSTQAAWLRRGIPGAHAVGTVDAWDPRWRQLAAGDFAQWWFADSSTAEHVALVLASHRARRSSSGHLALEDRGLPMLRAACAATAAVKEGISPGEALRLVDRITASLPTAGPRREVHILLRRADNPEEEARKALLRERRPADERYTAYQHALAEIVAAQAEQGEYDAVLEIGDTPILDVQRQLRTRLAFFGIPAGPLPDATPGRLWVLAGLSESGKSTVGALLRDEHGVARLKTGYLLEIAALRAGTADPYQWPEPEQAERLTEEILRFAEACKAGTVSVESAHRLEATAHLKRVWGNRCQVVYVDAPLSARVARAAETCDQLRSRDAVKTGRGAHRIEEIADRVIDNSGPASALKFAVARLAAADRRGRAVPDHGRVVSNKAWLMKAAADLADEHVAAVLATGSTGTAAWRDGWSDLDLLVVRDTVPASWLRGVAGTLSSPTGVKVGVSAFTTADIEVLRVPPRVVQSLRRAPATAYCRGGCPCRRLAMSPVVRVGHHRRFTANHTWHVDAAGLRLFIKASPSRQEADAERAGHERISRFYTVPRLRGTRSIGNWTVLAYDRWPYLGTDAGLLLDEISRACLTGDTTRLDECLTAVLGRYRDVISRTLRRAPLAATVGKLYRDRAAPGGRLDRYYHSDRPWPLPHGTSIRPSDLAALTLAVNGREHCVDFPTMMTWLRSRLAASGPVWAAVTQGDPTDFNLGWSPAGGPVWFDYDTGGLNALPGEFACFLLYQRLHGAWLTPRYNRSAFRDHPSALAAASLARPQLETRHCGGLLRIDYRHAPGPGRSHAIRRYLTEIVQPAADHLGIRELMDWLRPYLVMRILGVYSLADLHADDVALSLSLLAEALDPATTLTVFLGADHDYVEVTGRRAYGGPQ